MRGYDDFYDICTIDSPRIVTIDRGRGKTCRWVCNLCRPRGKMMLIVRIAFIPTEMDRDFSSHSRKYFIRKTRNEKRQLFSPSLFFFEFRVAISNVSLSLSLARSLSLALSLSFSLTRLLALALSLSRSLSLALALSLALSLSHSLSLFLSLSLTRSLSLALSLALSLSHSLSLSLSLARSPAKHCSTRYYLHISEARFN